MKTKVILFALITITLIAICPGIRPFICIAQDDSGREIDVFTQKAPFDGKGPNQPSDAFQPQEMIYLYAMVTYNGAPLANKLVAFQIEGPDNPFGMITVSGSAVCDLSGMANYSFRVPWPAQSPETKVFGQWHVIATVDIAEVAVNDTLAFRVGWIVEIKTISTLDDQLTPQNSFPKQSRIFFNFTLENIAFTPKMVTIIEDVFDAHDYPIIHLELDDLLLQPGENYALASSNIPLGAGTGQAQVTASAYTAPPSEGGILYSPAAHTTFGITGQHVRDISITSLIPSKTVAEIGEIIEVTMFVRNKGTDAESFNVSTYSNQTLIGKEQVTNLPSSTDTQIIFWWNTTNAAEGNYVLSGMTDILEGETDVADNSFTDGIITLYLKPQETVDVAVSYVSVQPLTVEIGQPVQIEIEVTNLGNVPEGFNTAILYDSTQFAVLQVDFLAPGAQTYLAYSWNTTGMMEGNFTIKAHIPPLPDEKNTANNWYTDGTVWIKAPHPAEKIHSIAITDVYPSIYQAYPGDNIGITVEAANLGDYDETTNVTVYANMSKIDARSLLHLESRSNTTLSFTWNTSNMNPGNYSIWAHADLVPGETNTDDNTFIDGVLTLLTGTPPPSNIHDVTVTSVQPQNQTIFIGQKLTILVTVKNKGNYTETFNVTLYYERYYDSRTIQTITVNSLLPASEQTLTFQWDTSNVEAGNYTIRAYAEPVPGETNIQDNFYTDGTVEVKNPQQSTNRDVAVVFLSASPVEVQAGENVTITLTVLNLGTMPENFDTSVYYDSNLIQVIPVTGLAPYIPKTMTTTWNTKNVNSGTYAISASATILEGEINTANNSLKDGNVTIESPPGIPYWIFITILLAGLALLALLLLLLGMPTWTLLIPLLTGLALLALLLLLPLLRRRKKKKKEKPVVKPHYVILSYPHI